MATPPGPRKAPPNLRIRVPRIPHIAVPGPNAFTVATQAQQEQVDEIQPGRQPHKEERGSAMTTFTQLMDAARSVSPRKSKHSSTSTRHSSTLGSTTRSRHSERSVRSTPSNPPTEGVPDFGGILQQHHAPTARGEMESRTEKKLFRLVGQQLTSPTSGEAPPDAQQVVNLRRPEIPKTRYMAATDGAVKSPKKKIFGMSIPNFRTSASSAESASEPIPEMPQKAAQLLVTGSAYKRREQVRPQRPAPPTQLLNHHGHGSRRQKNQHTAMRSSQQSPSNRSSSPSKSVQWTSAVTGDESPGHGIPPTPPEKDTPPEIRSLQQPQSNGLGVALTEDTRIKRFQVTSRVAVTHRETPNFARPTSVIPSEGGNSPVKFVPYTAQEYAALVQGTALPSSKAVICVDHGGLEEGIRSAPLDQDNRESVQVRQDRLSEQDHVSRRLTNRMSGVALPPRFYTPSGFRISMWDSEDESSRPSRNINPERYFLPRTPKQQPPPSLSSNDPNSDNIDMMFQGAASEIDPDSSVGQAVHATLQSNPPAPSTIENGFAVRAMPEIQVSDRESREECDRIGPLNEHVLPHNSSSRLTDMLRVVSPSKTGYNDFYPEHPSAMPAPLYGSHVPPMTHSNMSPIPPSDLLAVPLADGRTILNHFYMINEHIDVLGRSMYDQVERQKDQQLAALEAQTRDVVTRLEQKIDDVKSTLSASLGEYIDRASNRHHAIDGKMNGLLDFVKAEVVGSLTSQSQKTAEMELGLKQLQKTVQDLQKTIESRVTLPAPVMPHGQYAAPPGLGAPQVGNLPHARSQPSLGVGFYDTANEMARDSNQRLPPVPEVRNEGRYRYGNPNPNGWQQHRSPNQGREGKENMYAFSSPPNPYNSSNGNGPYSGGYMGGYPGYFPGGQSDQGYNYSPSAK